MDKPAAHLEKVHVLTFDKPAPEPPEPCSGGYTCICTICQAERHDARTRGVRGNPSDPFRKAA